MVESPPTTPATVIASLPRPTIALPKTPPNFVAERDPLSGKFCLTPPLSTAALHLEALGTPVFAMSHVDHERLDFCLVLYVRLTRREGRAILAIRPRGVRDMAAMPPEYDRSSWGSRGSRRTSVRTGSR
jgi:hypothetical protein